MTPRSCAATVSLLGAIWGCGASTESTGSPTAISPNLAYNDSPLDVKIDAVKESPFRPAYEFDTGEGSTAEESGSYAVTLRAIGGPNDPMPVSVALEAVEWKSALELRATIPAGVPAGAYDVLVTDPRGQTAKLSQAFTSLGPDEQAPGITINSPEPGSIIGALSTISVVVSANDGHGLVRSMRVAVTAGTDPEVKAQCTGTPAPQKTCLLQFLPPVPADDAAVVKVTVSAIDSLDNEATPEPTEFRLVPRPVLSSATPTEGPTGGGTEIVVRGSDFIVPVDPSQGSALLIDGQTVPGATVTPTEIRGVAGRHDPGMAMIQVANGIARSAPRFFEFVAPPSVRLVDPRRGPLAGGTWIAVVGNHFRDGVIEISVDGNPLEDPCFVGENRIEGRVPAGAAPGPVTVTAYDLIGGTGTLVDAFTYDAGEGTSPDPADDGLGLGSFICPGAP